jgi:hypothetical protein
MPTPMQIGPSLLSLDALELSRPKK